MRKCSEKEKGRKEGKHLKVIFSDLSLKGSLKVILIAGCELRNWIESWLCHKYLYSLGQVIFLLGMSVFLPA